MRFNSVSIFLRWVLVNGLLSVTRRKKKGKQSVIKVANIIEEGRLGGPQVRIAEVARVLTSSQGAEVSGQWSENRGIRSVVNSQQSENRKQKAGDRRQFEDTGSDSEDNIDTTVIFPKYESEDFRKRLEEYDIPYIQLPLHRLAKGWKYLLRYVLWFPIEILILLRVLKKNKFDVVHVSGGAWQVKGVIAGRLAGCKVLWHLNDTKMPGLVRAFFRIVAKWGADGFILSAFKVKEYYLEKFKELKHKPKFLIRPPVNCSFYSPKLCTKKSNIFCKNKLIITTVANINPLKGLEHFINMAYNLNKNYANMIEFYIVGPCYDSQAKYFNKLRELVSKYNLSNVNFWGQSSEVRNIYKDTDIYLCSSLTESGPMSLFEAMSMEKSIVSTDVGDVKDLIVHGVNGYIVPPADPKALAYYVGKLIENSELRNDFGKKARRTALEKLDVSIVAKKHVETYTWAEGGWQKSAASKMAKRVNE